MANRFKKGDVVFFIDKSSQACQQHPLKGTIHEEIGIITKVIDHAVSVEWDSGLEYTYYLSSIRHRHRVRKFFRYLFDIIKEELQNFRSEITAYRMYRSFKKGDIVCLKHSSLYISTCEIGSVVRKNFPSIVIQWDSSGLGHSSELARDIEHCTGIDPNKLFKSYKRVYHDF